MVDFMQSSKNFLSSDLFYLIFVFVANFPEKQPTGGGALLRGLQELISRSTGIKCVVAPRPAECVALGTGLALANIGKLSEGAQGSFLFSARRRK